MQAEVARAEAKVIKHSSKDSLENAWRQYKATQKEEKEISRQIESKLDGVVVEEGKSERVPDFPADLEVLTDDSWKNSKT